MAHRFGNVDFGGRVSGFARGEGGAVTSDYVLLGVLLAAVASASLHMINGAATDRAVKVGEKIALAETAPAGAFLADRGSAPASSGGGWNGDLYAYGGVGAGGVSGGASGEASAGASGGASGAVTEAPAAQAGAGTEVADAQQAGGSAGGSGSATGNADGTDAGGSGVYAGIGSGGDADTDVADAGGTTCPTGFANGRPSEVAYDLHPEWQNCTAATGNGNGKGNGNKKSG